MKMNREFISIFLLISLLVRPLQVFATPFILEEEFPNYFLQTGSNSGPAITPKDIEAAIDSISRRLAIPYIRDPKGSMESQLEDRGFLDVLKEKVRKHDPGAKVYLAGGVVRSLLGYLYKKVYTAKQKNPTLNTKTILDRITYQDKEIIPLKALGIGSDFDVLISPSEEHKANFDQVNKDAMDFINSAQNFAHLRDFKSKLKYSIVPIADVKDYDEQMNRAVGQGGSTMDFLAFDLNSRQIRTPTSHPEIVQDFIRGEYDYLPPSNTTGKEDPDKQIVRGLRPLLEIPFLRVKASGRVQFTNEIKRFTEKVSKGLPISDAALEQFEKLVRNSNFGGARNRIFRSNEEIETLARELVLEIGKQGTKGMLVIPEFLDNIDPLKRKVKPLPERVLMNFDSFIQNHTHGGVVFHGTPGQHTLSILRNGLLLSNDRQGTASYGRGSYSTNSYSVANGYAKNIGGNTGTVFQITFDRSKNPRILYWPEAEKDPEIIRIVAEAKEAGVDKFEYLARQYGVDIIVDTHVLLQNSAVLNLPKNITDLINLQAQIIERKFENAKDFKNSETNSGTAPMITIVPGVVVPRPLPSDDIFEELQRYMGLYRLGKSLNHLKSKSGKPGSNWQELLQPDQLIVRGISHLAPELLSGIQHGSTTDAILETIIEKGLKHPSPEIQKIAASSLVVYQGKNSKSLLNELLSHQDTGVRKAAAIFLAQHGSDEYADWILKALSDPDKNVSATAVEAIEDYQGKRVKELIFQAAVGAEVDPLKYSHTDIAHVMTRYSKEDLESIVMDLLDPKQSESHRQIGAVALLNPLMNQNEKQLKIALSDPSLKVRVNAVYALSKYQGPNAKTYLKQAALDPEENIRRAASEAIAHYSGSELADTMSEFLQPNQEEALRLVGVSSLMNRKLTQNEKYFNLALADPSLKVRKAAANSLPFYKGANIVEWVTRAAQDPSPEVQDVLGTALQHYQIPHIQEISERLLKSDRPEIRKLGIQSLTNRGINNNGELFKLALADEDPQIRAEAAGMLSSYRGDDFPHVMLKALKDQDAEIRSSAKHAFQAYHGPHATAFLKLLLDQEEEQLRELAASSLTKEGAAAEVADLFQKALSDPSIHVRRNAARLMHYYKGKNAKDLFAQLIQDSDRDLQYSALGALQYYSGSDAREIILHWVDSKQPHVIREMAFHTLSNPNIGDVEPILNSALQEDNPQIWNEVASVISNSKGKNTLELVKKLLKKLEDPRANSVLKENIGSIFRNYRGDDFFQLISHFMDPEHYSEEVRSIAAKGIANNKYNEKSQERGKLIKKLAADPSPEMRKAAADGLSNYTEDDKNDLYLRLLTDSNEQVRSSAASSLRSSNDDQILNILEFLLDEKHPVEARVGAAEGLSHWKIGKNAAIFNKALTASAVEVRRKAAQALYNYQGPDRFEVFSRVLQDPDEQVRKNAGSSLLNIYDESLFDLMKKLLASPHSIVRAEAARGGMRNQKLREVSILNGLIDQISQDPDPSVRKEVAAILGGYTGHNKVELWDHYLNDPEPSVRDQARLVLAQSYNDNNKKFRELLLSLLNPNRTTEARRSAARALRNSNLKDRDDLILKAATDEDPQVRKDAVDAGIEMIRNPNVSDNHELFSLFASDPDPSVQALSASNLRHYRGKDFLELAMKFLNSPNSTVKMNAESQIENFYSGPELPKLIESLLESKDQAFRMTGLSFLKNPNIKTEDQSRLFKQVLSDEDPQFRNHAIAMIAYDRGEDAPDHLEKVLQSSDPQAVSAGMKALDDAKDRLLAAIASKLLHSDKPLELRRRIAKQFYRLFSDSLNPQEAAAIFALALNDPDEEVRMYAARAIRNPSVKPKHPWIKKALSDSSQRVQELAIHALDYYDGDDSLKLFELMADSPDKYLRNRAGHVLANYKGNDLMTYAQETLANGQNVSSDFKAALVAGVLANPRVSENHNFYVQAISDKSQPVREVAAGGLHSYKGNDLAKVLEIGLQDPDGNVRYHFHNKWRSYEKKDLPSILDRFLDPAQPSRLRSAAIDKLSQVKSSGASPSMAMSFGLMDWEQAHPLFAKATSDPDPALRKRAVETLISYDCQAEPHLGLDRILARTLADPVSEISQVGGRLASNYCTLHSAQCPALLNRLLDPAHPLIVRKQAVAMISQPFVKKNAELFSKALQDPEESVAVEALRLFNEKESFKGSDSEKKEIQMIADETAKKYFEDQDLAKLSMKNSSNWLDVATNLAQYKGTKSSAIRIYRAAIEHPDTTVRTYAASALSSCIVGYPEVVSLFKKGLNDKSYAVRRDAATALAKYARCEDSKWVYSELYQDSSLRAAVTTALKGKSPPPAHQPLENWLKQAFTELKKFQEDTGMHCPLTH